MPYSRRGCAYISHAFVIAEYITYVLAINYIPIGRANNNHFLVEHKMVHGIDSCHSSAATHCGN